MEAVHIPTSGGRFEGTRTVGEDVIDAQALKRYFVEHIEGCADLNGDFVIEQFNGGQSNPTYKIRFGERNFVMRSKPGPVARLLPTAHAIEREFRVQSALGTTDFPVSRMYALCEDESVIGRAFYIMDHLDGRNYWEQSMPELQPAERGAIYREMNRVIASLHKTDYKALGLQTYGKETGFLERTIKRWTTQYRATEMERVDAMDALIEWLPRNIPATSHTVVAHGDFRLDNMILARDEARVVGVLDWELSTLGDPAADFAYHCMGWHSVPEGFRGIKGLDLEALGIPSESEYVAMYERATGFSVGEHWNFYIAFNLFKHASILQGIARRVALGTASAERGGDAGAKVKIRAAEAWAVANELRL